MKIHLTNINDSKMVPIKKFNVIIANVFTYFVLNGYKLSLISNVDTIHGISRVIERQGLEQQHYNIGIKLL